MQQQQQQHTEEHGLLGKLCPGEKKLEGKTFYLDNVKKRPTTLLLEALSLLGGRVESFLHKDVSFVVTGSDEGLKEQKCAVAKAGAKASEEAQRPVKQAASVLSKDKPRPGTSRPALCGSRGKALLEKAIRNNERLQGSSVLANARSWGVKILSVDGVLSYLKELKHESFGAKHKRPERTYTKQQSSHVVKAAALRSPYVKIEDLSKKYKPLYMQSMNFPTLCYSGRFSPFECPPPPRFEKRTEPEETKSRQKSKVGSSSKDKSPTPCSFNPSPWRPRKKDLAYCECCYQPFANLEEHLQSDQHRAFVLDSSNYSVVDQLVAEMHPEFNTNPSQQPEELLNRPPTPLPIQDVCELVPLTDAETELAVRALRRQGSSPSPEDPCPVPEPATPPPDIQPLTPQAVCSLPDSQPHGSPPAMPVLDIEPREHSPVSPQPQRLTPCPDTHYASLDPYSLPPILSPQIVVHDHLMEPHSFYSEPPVLSPQCDIAEDDMKGHTSEMDTVESESVPSAAGTNADGVIGSNQKSILGLSGALCPIIGLECAKLSSHSSCSLPRKSTAAPNSKKRCRFSSPEHKQSKKRRTETLSGSDCWTEKGNHVKPESDIMAKDESCSLFDRVSCQTMQSCSNPKVSFRERTWTVENFGIKRQPQTAFCVQNSTQEPNEVRILGPSSNSLTDQPSGSHFTTDKAPAAFSSQDSQQSLSHSTSICIESALIPDLAKLAPSSSESDWDCELLSRLGPPPAAPAPPSEQSCELDKELLHRPCTWMHDSSYESRLHTALQPSAAAASLCGDEMDASTFSRTVVHIVEVQH